MISDEGMTDNQFTHCRDFIKSRHPAKYRRLDYQKSPVQISSNLQFTPFDKLIKAENSRVHGVWQANGRMFL